MQEDLGSDRMSETKTNNKSEKRREEETMPMSRTEMERALRQLRLSGMGSTLETRALEVNQGEITFIEGFTLLIQDELDRRRTRMIERRFKLSGLKEKKTLSEFDWGFNPKVPKKECFELVALKFLRNGEDALILGSTGTGKSHIAQAVAYAAILEGYKVAYRVAHEFFTDMFEAEQVGTRKKLLKLFREADLLVIDDLFLKKRIPENSSDDLQEIILERYATRKSTIVTSNRMLDDWGTCLGDNAVASAILDRLLHHGRLLKFEGKSYRLKEAAYRLTHSDNGSTDK